MFFSWNSEKKERFRRISNQDNLLKKMKIEVSNTNPGPRDVGRGGLTWSGPDRFTAGPERRMSPKKEDWYGRIVGG
jgi:hypothetical protein